VRGRAGIAAAVAALVVTGAADAARLMPAQRAALTAVSHAVAAGRIDRKAAARDRAEIARAGRMIRRLPSGRREHLAVALYQIASFSGRLTGPRAVALFGQLKANDDYFARHSAPAARTDIVAADGVVYRYFPGRCFEFHPLAEFAALNTRVSARDARGAERLARALIARGVHQSGGTGWEYYFGFGGGRAPWLSGIAQAVAAQAFARAATLVPSRAAAFLRAARSAYRPIPGRLTTSVAAGPWIRLYGFDSTPVLNAQLQAVVSLRKYVTKTGDTSAAMLARRMQQAAATTLRRFDTGYWTYYALPGRLSTLHYQDYVVRLLRKLSSADARFADAAVRFASYRRQPPAFRLAEARRGELRFWLSKPAKATVYSAAGRTQRLSLGGGWRTLAWKKPRRGGIYPIALSAVDVAGNRASFQALPLVRVAHGARTRAVHATSSTANERPALLVGARLDDPLQAARAQRLGLKLVRIGVDWPTGASTPELALSAAFRPLTGAAALVELRLKRLPVDDVETTALAQYAAALAQQVPGIHDLTLAPAPSAAAAAYAAALTAVRDAVHAALHAVAVGPLVDASTAPRATVKALGHALGARADVVIFRTTPTGAGIARLVSALESSFRVTPPVLIDGLATPKRISAHARGKTYAAAITDAACSQNVTGIVVDRLFHTASAHLVAAAAAPAQRGTVVCPGLASKATASTLEFPTKLDASAPAAVVLSCTRDCLYLITLDDARGRPVAARRGTLRGAGRALTLELPKTRLGRSVYRLDVRLVDRVNPGEVTRLTSGALPVSRS
jgi:hypothetical protein